MLNTLQYRHFQRLHQHSLSSSLLSSSTRCSSSSSIRVYKQSPLCFLKVSKRLPLDVWVVGSSGDGGGGYGETEEESVSEVEMKDISDDKVPVEDSSFAEKKPVSPILASLYMYKEALASNNKSKISEIEAFFQSIEAEKNSLAAEVATLTEELEVGNDRVLKISLAFASFRTMMENQRLSLVSNVKEEMVESLLSVLHSFERANSEIKVESEGEEKINDSYQSIYKQFVEILRSLGILPPEIVESEINPLDRFGFGSKLAQVRDQISRVLSGFRSNFGKTWLPF